MYNIKSLDMNANLGAVSDKPGLTCTKHLNLRCSLSLSFPFVKIM